MKKAIVTGVTGFVGSWVAKELIKHDIEVIGVIREECKSPLPVDDKRIKIVRCNLDNIAKLSDLVTDRDIDVAYHFAWQGVSNEDARKSDIQLNNVKYTLDFINVLPELGCGTFIGAGSLHESESFYDMKENKRITNLGYMYKAAKISAHWMGKALAGSKNIKFFWPVICNTYGVGETSQRLINTTIRKILNGEMPMLTEGKQNYDFVYISDVANAFYLIGEKGIDGTNYMIGSGDVKPLRKYMEKVGEITNQMNHSSVELGFGKIGADVVYLPEEIFSINDLHQDTGFVPQISFEDGITETVKWIKDNMN